MKDKVFIDTNVLIYYVSNNTSKKNKAKNLLMDAKKKDFMISSQIITEFVSVTLRKKILSYDQSICFANEFMNILQFSFIDKATIALSFEMIEKYKYSIWDSLVIASALENNCSIVFTEDMQDDQIIEDCLKIVNPFKLKKKQNEEC